MANNRSSRRRRRVGETVFRSDESMSDMEIYRQPPFSELSTGQSEARTSSFTRAGKLMRDFPVLVEELKDGFSI